MGASERVRGFAPLPTPWKGVVLLLYYTRNYLNRAAGSRTQSNCSQSNRTTVIRQPVEYNQFIRLFIKFQSKIASKKAIFDSKKKFKNSTFYLLFSNFYCLTASLSALPAVNLGFFEAAM